MRYFFLCTLYVTPDDIQNDTRLRF